MTLKIPAKQEVFTGVSVSINGGSGRTFTYFRLISFRITGGTSFCGGEVVEASTIARHACRSTTSYWCHRCASTTHDGTFARAEVLYCFGRPVRLEAKPKPRWDVHLPGAGNRGGSVSALDCRTVRQRRLTSSFRLDSPARNLPTLSCTATLLPRHRLPVASSLAQPQIASPALKSGL